MYCSSTFIYVSSNYIIMCWWWCQCDDGDANVMPMFCQCVDGDANVMIPCDDGNDVFLCNRGRCRCTQSHDWMRKTANGSHDWMPKTDRHQGSRRHVTARSRRRRCHRSRPHPPAPHLVPGPIGPLAGHVAVAYHKALSAAAQVITCAPARRTYAWSLLHVVLGALHNHVGGHRAGLQISRHSGNDMWRDGSDEETLRV